MNEQQAKHTPGPWTSNAGVRWRCQHCGASKALGEPCPNSRFYVGVCPPAKATGSAS